MSFQTVPPKQGSSKNLSERQHHINPDKEEKDDEGLQEKKKKRKKKVGSKEERKLKREAEKLKQIYAPKDSHIQMITPEILQKLRGENPTRSQSQRTQGLFSSQDSRTFPVIYPTVNQSSQSPSLPKDGHNKDSPDSTYDFPALIQSAPMPSTSKKVQLKETLHSNNIREAKTSNEYESMPEIDKRTNTWVGVKPQIKENNPNESTLNSGICQKSVEPLLEIPIVSKRKPSKKPLIISINDLIEAKKEAKAAAKTVERKRKDSNEKFTIGNLLDSSGPVVMNRGKIREKAKPKRDTPLKKAIMKTRALRKANITTNFAKYINSNTVEKLASETETELPTNSNIASIIKSENKTNIQGYCPRSYCDSNPVQAIDVNQNSKNEPLKPLKTDADIFAEKLKEIIEDVECNVESSDNTDNVEISKELHLKIKTEIHSKKFRPYCDMYLSKTLHGKIMELLKELHRFQDRLYHSDPLKYKIKKRYIHGLKDVHANLGFNKLQLIIIAPDIEPNNEKGGLDEKLDNIISIAREKNVPYIFSGNRFILGKPIRIKTPVSAIGILDYQAAEDLYKTVVDEACKLREEYQTDFSNRLFKLKAEKMECSVKCENTSD